MWEALDEASYYRLGNLVALVDVNRLGQRGETDLGWRLETYAARAESFGARVRIIDGHDLDEIDEVLGMAGRTDRPLVVFARTIKGKGFGEIEDSPAWHGKALPADMAERAVAQLGGERHLTVRGPLPRDRHTPPVKVPTGGAPRPTTIPSISTDRPRWQVGDKISTRRAYGDALVALGARDDKVVALDGEVSNSTYAAEFARAFPDRFFEMFIAEQQLVAAATGLSARGYKPYASTFAAFLSRAFDFIRMGAISGIGLRLSGSHAGVEIGADGPSQMALEDLAMMQAVHGSTVLYPSDATSTAALVDAMAETGGISYMRTTRGAYPVLYGADESFPVGGSKTLRSSNSDAVSLIGAGITVHEALAAADRLAREGIAARVIDSYSIKPIDDAAIAAAATATNGRIVVAEDHHPEGGLGAAVTASFSRSGLSGARVKPLAVRGMPGSGTGAQLLAWAGIDADGIAAAAREMR